MTYCQLAAIFFCKWVCRGDCGNFNLAFLLETKIHTGFMWFGNPTEEGVFWDETFFDVWLRDTVDVELGAHSMLQLRCLSYNVA